jgi:general secretion pathway protein L
MLHDFFVWWLGQLRDLLPARLRRRSLSIADATVITPIGLPGQPVDAVAIGVRRNGKEAQTGQIVLGAAGVAPPRRDNGRPTVLRLRGSEVLGKTLSLPLAAERDLDQVLGFEMDRETPFKLEDIYWSHRVEGIDRQNGRISVRLLLIPRASLAALLGALRQHGLAPRRVEIADGPDAGALLPLDDSTGHPVRPHNRLLKPAAAAFALLALAAVAIPFLRQSMALGAIDRHLVAARVEAAEAEELRREIDRLSGSATLILTERDKAGRPLEVLAATTRVLPDDSYLTELELRQRKLTLSGRSAAAARLIAAFAGNSVFHNPAFAAPVTRIEALRSEIFTIIAEVAP